MRMLRLLSAAAGLLAVSAVTAEHVPALPVKWEYPIGGIPGGAALNTVGDTLYVAASDAQLYAIDAFSGTVNWKAPLPAPSSCTPLVIGINGLYSTVVVVATDGSVNFFNPTTGDVTTQKLMLPDETPQNCEPTYDPATELVYVGVRESGSTYAINYVTGQLVWGPNAGFSTVTIEQGGAQVLTGVTDGYIYEYNATSGASTAFSYSGPASNFLQPQLTRGTVVFTSPSGFIAVNYESQESTYELDDAVSTWSSVALTDDGDKVFFGTDTAMLYAVDPYLQSIIWNINVNDRVVTTPTIAGGSNIVVGDLSGMVYVVPTTGSRIKGQYNMTKPVAKFSRIAVSERFGLAFVAVAGKVAALDISGSTHPPVTTPAPTGGMIVENRCGVPGCNAECRQVVLAPGCAATSATTSVNRAKAVNNGTTQLAVTEFTNSTTCSGDASPAMHYTEGTCYSSEEGGDYFAFVAIP